MGHQQALHPAQSVKKSSDKLASESWNTHEQKLDMAQQMWTDWRKKGVYKQTKRTYIGSGEDVCLEMLP